MGSMGWAEDETLVHLLLFDIRGTHTHLQNIAEENVSTRTSCTDGVDISIVMAPGPKPQFESNVDGGFTSSVLPRQ